MTEPWGLLRGEIEGLKSVELSGEICVTMGRGAECHPDFTFPTVKKISQVHCSIFRQVDGEGKSSVILEDKSANGTFVNGAKVGKGVQYVLKDGDHISLTYLRTTDHSDAVALYEFKDLSKPKRPALARDNSAATDIEEEDAPGFDPNQTQIDIIPEDVSMASPAPVSQTTKSEGAVVVSPKQTSEPPSAPSASSNTVAIIEDEITCGICLEVLYRCVSCIPCMHNFCSPCFSEWVKKNKTCPQCRQKATQVRRNHAINSIVDKFLAANPSLAPSEERKKELDARNTITGETLQLSKGKKRNRDDDEDEDEDDDEDEEDEDEEDDEDDDEDDDDDDDGRPYRRRRHNIPVPFFGLNQIKCPECDQPGQDGYQCPANTVLHLQCAFCATRMPNRPDCTRAQRCALCFQVCCDIYYGGCKSGVGRNFLRPITQHNPGNIAQKALLGNEAETSILIDYVKSKNLSTQDLLAEMLRKVDSKEFKYEEKNTMPMVTAHFAFGLHQPPAQAVGSDITTCANCSLRVFNNLLYQYRVSIEGDLPAKDKRPDCWYGRECRTQHTNPTHAKRLNHICDLTKR